MKKGEVGSIVLVGVCLSGLNEVPLGFIEERIASDVRATEAHTEEASTVVMVVPCGFVALIALCAKEK